MTDKATDGKYCPDCYQAVRPGDVHSKEGCQRGGIEYIECETGRHGECDGEIGDHPRGPCICRCHARPAPVRAPSEDGPGLWFSSNPVTQDLVFHESEAAAKQAAEEAVDDLEEQVADDNYHMNENGGEGCYGQVIARVAEFRKDVKDDPEKAYDEEISFELKPVAASVHTPAGDALAEAVDRIVEVDALSHMGHGSCQAAECEVKHAEECAAAYRAAPTGPSNERAILEEIGQRLGIERDAEAEKSDGRWAKLGGAMDRLIEDRPCPHGMRLWKNCIECTPDPSPAGPARPTWPVLECEDCGGAGHRGESTVDTSSGPSGRKIACETCGGNEDSLGCGWIEIVSEAVQTRAGDKLADVVRPVKDLLQDLWVDGMSAGERSKAAADLDSGLADYDNAADDPT